MAVYEAQPEHFNSCVHLATLQYAGALIGNEIRFDEVICTHPNWGEVERHWPSW